MLALITSENKDQLCYPGRQDNRCKSLKNSLYYITNLDWGYDRHRGFLKFYDCSSIQPWIIKKEAVKILNEISYVSIN